MHQPFHTANHRYIFLLQIAPQENLLMLLWRPYNHKRFQWPHLEFQEVLKPQAM